MSDTLNKRFKSIPEFWTTEESGAKPNTVRLMDEPPPPPLPKRRKCDVCGGAGVVIDGDVARTCPECGAS